MSNEINISNPKISIGIPVYNGEYFIHRCLESLLAQTFTDFEIIISDNASTDSTHSICLEFAKKDKRIKIIRQNRNIGVIPNFDFVLQKASGKYFMWAAVDDYWYPEFINKNINVLELDETVVSSISDFRWNYDTKNDNDVKKNIIQKSKDHIKYLHSFYGTFDKRINVFLKIFQASEIYAIHRTTIIKQYFIREPFWMWDHAIILNLLKHGNFHVLDEILMSRHTHGISRGTIKSLSNSNVSLLKIIFLGMPFTYWCAKNLGLKIMIKNFIFFFKTNLRGEYIIITELTRICKRIIFKQEKHW